MAIDRPLPWVILGACGATYGSFTLVCKAQQYAKALKERRELPCKVVHRDTLERRRA